MLHHARRESSRIPLFLGIEYYFVVDWQGVITANEGY